MKNWKKIISALLILVISVSISACKDKSGDENASSGDKASPIKWLTTGDAGANAIVENDRIISAINEKLGIDLTVQVVPEGNIEKVNVAMASGDFPDIVTGSYGSAAAQQWIKDEVIIPLNPYFDSNPEIKNWLENDYPFSAVDDSFYGVPFTPQLNVGNTLIILRQDWLDNLNMEYPTNLEEFKDVMLAFTNDDPDGNGKNDTVGYTDVKPAGQLNFVFYAYGRKYADYALNENDEVIPWFEDDSFKPGMTYIKDLWDAGVIDKEFILNDNPKKEEKFYQGKAGAMIAPLFRHVSRHEDNLKQIFPEASIAYDLPPAGPDGSFGVAAQGKGGMITAVTAACKNQDKAVSFINYMISEEGTNLVRNGIEGVHYTKDGENIVYNEEERLKDGFSENGWAHPIAWGSFFWPLESNYLPETEPNRDRALETVDLGSEALVPNLIMNTFEAEIEYGSACEDVYNQYFSDILQDKISIEDGIKELGQKWRSAGGDKILEEANTVYSNQK